jgi:hypothetical protein
MALLLLLALFALGVLVLNGNFGERPRLILRGAMRPAAIVGGVGFVLGFTGPLGFLIGLAWGMAAGWLGSRNQ